MGKARIVITGKGKYEGQVTKRYLIIPSKVTQLYAKTKRLSSGRNFIKIKIKRTNKLFDYYLVQICTNKTFKNAKETKVEPKYVKKNIVPIKGTLKKGKRYYIKIKACKRNGNRIYRGPLSNTITVRGK